jgi:hypothetical protein
MRANTTLVTALALLLNSVVFNTDVVRANLSRELGFSLKDRIEHAQRMGWMCDRVVEAGGTAIGDFVCPDAKDTIDQAFSTWIEHIDAGRFQDTNRMFIAPRAIRPACLPGGNATMLARRGIESVRKPLTS